jgi:hypothetical protein
MSYRTDIFNFHALYVHIAESLTELIYLIFMLNVENRKQNYIMDIFLENSLLLQLKNAGIM